MTFLNRNTLLILSVFLSVGLGAQELVNQDTNEINQANQKITPPIENETIESEGVTSSSQDDSLTAAVASAANESSDSFSESEEASQPGSKENTGKKSDIKQGDSVLGSKEKTDNVKGEKARSNRGNVGKKPQVEKEISLSERSFGDVMQSLLIWILRLLIFAVLFGLAYYLFYVFSKKEKQVKILLDENLKLQNELNDLKRRMVMLESQNKPMSLQTQMKTDEEIDSIRSKKIQEIRSANKLNSEELSNLNSRMENRWVTIGHSSIGKMHIDSNPKIPCQDNHFYKKLEGDWNILISCDGAGSAKYSHFGSEFLATKALPENLSKEVSKNSWFKKNDFPSQEEWYNTSLKLVKSSFDELSSLVEKENDESVEVGDFASTVILTLYNNNGALVVNIGDGRGGFLNSKGEFKALFTPYKGTESNETVFITSPIWEQPEKYIQTDVIKDKLLSVFVLSDGMEKATFECSNMTNDVFIDANIPSKRFFLPVLTTIKNLPKADEQHLKKMWKDLLEAGSDSIKNEPDDKTLVLSFLK